MALAPFLFPANPLTAARGALARVAAGLAGALRTSTALVERADGGDRRAVLQRVTDDIAGGCGWSSSSHWSSRWSGRSSPRSPGGRTPRTSSGPAAVEQFRGVDHSGMASVVRRPLHRMVDDLTAFRP